MYNALWRNTLIIKANFKMHINSNSEKTRLKLIQLQVQPLHHQKIKLITRKQNLFFNNFIRYNEDEALAKALMAS